MHSTLAFLPFQQVRHHQKNQVVENLLACLLRQPNNDAEHLDVLV